MTRYKPIYERFEAKYIPEPNTGCWLWIACTGPTGYGFFGYQKKRYYDRTRNV